MEDRVVNNIIAFLERCELKGREVPMFYEIMEVLHKEKLSNLSEKQELESNS